MSQEYIERLEDSLVKSIELPTPKEDEQVMATYGEAKESITERDDAKRMMFEMHDVEASNIRCMGYNKTHQQLRVQFTNGGVYQYKNIPFEIYDEMIQSKAIGPHFSKNIRNVYECVKLN